MALLPQAPVCRVAPYHLSEKTFNISSISGISGISGSSHVWASASNARTQHQANMFAKTDADGNGSVNISELSTMLSKISETTGNQMGDASEMMGKMDSDGDSSLSSSALGEGTKSFMPPPPSTMEFAHSRGSSGSAGGGGPGEALFNKADVNSDGLLDAGELQTLTEEMSSQTGEDVTDMLAALDSDGDENLSMAEFEAGRPEGPPGAGGAGEPGKPGGVGVVSESSDATTCDALDTNEDGTVSEMERLAGALEDLVETQASGESRSGINSEIAKLAQQLYEQSSGSGQTTVSSLFSEAV